MSNGVRFLKGFERNPAPSLQSRNDANDPADHLLALGAGLELLQQLDSQSVYLLGSSHNLTARLKFEDV